MPVHRTRLCDQTGEVLESDGTRLRPYLTLKNNLVYQKADGGYAYLPNLDEQLAFRDAGALADWTDARIAALNLTPLAE